MSANPTRLEASYTTVLAVCRDCPPWRRLELSHAGALRQAAQHVELVHGDHRLASNMRDRARKLDTPS